MSMSPLEIERLAERLAELLVVKLSRPANDGLIDVHGAAELLGCSVPTVERLTRRGELPSTKVGRLRRYCPVALRNNATKGPDDE